MNFLRSGMLALALFAAVPAIAQAASTSTDMQILANDVNADKKVLSHRTWNSLGLRRSPSGPSTMPTSRICRRSMTA